MTCRWCGHLLSKDRWGQWCDTPPGLDGALMPACTVRLDGYGHQPEEDD